MLECYVPRHLKGGLTVRGKKNAKTDSPGEGGGTGGPLRAKGEGGGGGVG